LVAGTIHFYVYPLPAIMTLLKSGTLRALAVASPKRAEALPDLPTMAEAGLPGFEVSGFLGLLAPARTPPAIIRQLGAAIEKISKQKDFIERFAGFGMEPVGSTPEECDRFTREQIDKWAKVLRAAGYAPQ